MSSQAVMKRQILALAKREPSNEELQKIKQSLAVYKKLTKEEQTKINEMVNDAHAKLDSEGKFAKGGKTKTQSMKTALTEFKNKIGIKKFKRATTGTDIKKDIGIPAQKVGKRIVRKKGKTTNQYGTFKNQVGTTYYEGRPNRSDVNQPSEKRKIKLADGGQIKYAIVNDDSDKIYFRSPQLDLVKLKLKEFQEIYPNEKIIIQKFAKGGEVGSEHEFVVTFQNSETGKLLKLNVLGTDEKNAIENAYMESEFNEPYEVYSVKKFAKGGEIGEKSAKFKVGDEVYSYQNKTESAPIAYAKFSAWDKENGAHENDVWKYKLSLKDGYSNWINEDSLSKTKMTTYAEGGEVSQYIDGLSKQEVLSKSIVYDNGGESYDRYTIFTPDGSVYGMSETAEGFNQYVGDSSEIEKGKHLGRKLRSVPKGIQGAVLDRMLDDEQMFAKGGKLSKEDALQKAIDMGVDFDKDFHAQSVGNDLAELAKESGYKKSASSSGSTGRAFFYHLQKIYDKRKYAQGGKLSSKAKYIPKRDIAEIEIEKNGKSKSIDGANLLDGVYVKKGTKFADGGNILSKNYLYEISTPFPAINLAEQLEELFGQRRLILGDYNSSEELESVVMLNLTQNEIEKIQSEIEDAILFRTEIRNFEGMWMLNKYAKGGTIKKSLAEFKNKVGASKYREATRGVDIKADLQIPALKKGRRVVTTKGKTSNQYGTFKNQVGSVYYENRPNRYDVNQPSEKRKIKLADGGEFESLKVGSKVGFLRPQTGRYEYAEVISIDGNNVNLVVRHPKKVYLDNYFTESKERISKFSNTPSKDWKDGRPVVKIKYAQGGTFANGGVLEGAKIYVADLAEYNDGRLVGKWLDLSDYFDASELMGAIQEMLDEQTAKDKSGEVHEEWAVHDFEGFPRSFYSEYMGEKDFEKLYQIADVANDRGIPIDVLMEAVADFGADEDQIEEIADAYYGSVSTNFGNEFKDFAYEYIDSVGGFEGVSNADFYFDYDSFGSDARMDYTDEELEEYGYDELDDTELGERLVDEMGGVDQLGQKTIEMYFDYDKFGRDLEHDFISVKGDDGDYYFFNRNW